MALGKDKSAVPVNANVPEAVSVAFNVAMAQRSMKKQEALAEAMQEWADKASRQYPKGSKQIPEPVSSYSTPLKHGTIASLAERAAELAEGLRRIANEESGNAGGDPDSIVEELEQATEVEELKVKAARTARKSPAADREGVTK